MDSNFLVKPQEASSFLYVCPAKLGGLPASPDHKTTIPHSERAGTCFTAFKLIQMPASFDLCPRGRPSDLPSGEPQAGARARLSSWIPGWVRVVLGIRTW